MLELSRRVRREKRLRVNETSDSRVDGGVTDITSGRRAGAALLGLRGLVLEMMLDLCFRRGSHGIFKVEGLGKPEELSLGMDSRRGGAGGLEVAEQPGEIVRDDAVVQRRDDRVVEKLGVNYDPQVQSKSDLSCG